MIGAAHIRSNTPSQDAYAVGWVNRKRKSINRRNFSNRCVFAAVSDGAGSAMFGQYGAAISCLALMDSADKYTNRTIDTGCTTQHASDVPSKTHIENWIQRVRHFIQIRARRDNVPFKEFSSTIAGLMITPNGFAALQIGDSVVVGRRNGNWEVLLWPCTGEFESSTYFITDTPLRQLQLANGGREFDAFAVFTDGLNHLALSKMHKCAYSGFFTPMLRPLDQCKQAGTMLELSKQLKQYLGSDVVCDKTDDDKTLILLSRR